MNFYLQSLSHQISSPSNAPAFPAASVPSQDHESAPLRFFPRREPQRYMLAAREPILLAALHPLAGQVAHCTRVCKPNAHVTAGVMVESGALSECLHLFKRAILAQINPPSDLGGLFSVSKTTRVTSE